MNKCVNCHRNIEKETVWCPYCGAEQNPRYNLFFSFVLLILLAAIVLYGCYKYKEKEQKKKDIEQFGENYKYSKNNQDKNYDIYYRIEKEVRSDTGYELVGHLLNKESSTIYDVTIKFNCFDYNTQSYVTISDTAKSIKSNDLYEFHARGSSTLENCKLYIVEVGR